jgi:hypothetical protein
VGGWEERGIYEGGPLMPEKIEAMETAIKEARKKSKGVEVLFQ